MQGYSFCYFFFLLFLLNDSSTGLLCCCCCCLFFANTYVIILFGRHLSSSVETKLFSHFNAWLWMCYHCIWSWWIRVFLQFSTITVYLASLMGFAFGNRGFLWSSIWFELQFGSIALPENHRIKNWSISIFFYPKIDIAEIHYYIFISSMAPWKTGLTQRWFVRASWVLG